MNTLLARIAAALPFKGRIDPRHLSRSDGLTELDAEALANLPPPQVIRALDAWEDGILEPGQPPVGDASPQAGRIDDFARGEDGGGGTWREPYKKNGSLERRGFFAAWCLAGRVSADDRARVMPSTYRLWKAANDGHPRLSRLQPRDAEPGDVLVVASTGGKRWGDHITVVERVDLAAGLIYTVEGNARGWVPGGAQGSAADCREGVIRRTRPIGAPRHPRCPVSGLRQTARALAVYRWAR